MSTRIIQFAKGLRFPLFASEPGAPPDPYLASYVIRKYVRNRDFQTVYNVVVGLGICLRLCADASIDVVDRCRSGAFLGTEELEKLAKGLSRRGPTTARPHFNAFVEYAVDLGQVLAGHAGAEAKSAESFRIRAEEEAPLLPPAPDPVLGLTAEQRTLFLSVIQPPHARNPFGEGVAFRNFVFMQTSFNLGLRTSELLGLKVEDLLLAGKSGYLKVVVRPNDPDDPRRIPADQKTRGRTLPLSPELVAAFEVLKEDRRRHAMAKRHKYVFVNDRGEPLGDRGARKQYQILREAVPELSGLINHRLRHDWNDRWLEMMDERGWKPDEALRQQLYANGWEIGSPMPLWYGQREQARKANELMLEVQRRALVLRG